MVLHLSVHSFLFARQTVSCVLWTKQDRLFGIQQLKPSFWDRPIVSLFARPESLLPVGRFVIPPLPAGEGSPIFCPGIHLLRERISIVRSGGST